MRGPIPSGARHDAARLPAGRRPKALSCGANEHRRRARPDRLRRLGHGTPRGPRSRAAVRLAAGAGRTVWEPALAYESSMPTAGLEMPPVPVDVEGAREVEEELHQRARAPRRRARTRSRGSRQRAWRSPTRSTWRMRSSRSPASARWPRSWSARAASRGCAPIGGQYVQRRGQARSVPGRRRSRRLRALQPPIGAAVAEHRQSVAPAGWARSSRTRAIGPAGPRAGQGHPVLGGIRPTPPAPRR